MSTTTTATRLRLRRSLKPWTRAPSASRGQRPPRTATVWRARPARCRMSPVRSRQRARRPKRSSCPSDDWAARLLQSDTPDRMRNEKGNEVSFRSAILSHRPSLKHQSCSRRFATDQRAACNVRNCAPDFIGFRRSELA